MQRQRRRWDGAEARHRAIVVGSPPKFRGGTQKPRDLEMTLLELFPNSAYFIEKVRRPLTSPYTC